MPKELERKTRKDRIDPRLLRAGWRVVPFSEEAALDSYGTAAVEELPTGYGPADYALCNDGQVRGVVEAKKVRLDLRAFSPKRSGTREV